MITTQDLEIGTDTMTYNTVKNMVLRKLHEDGVLSDEQFEHYITEYQIIVVKRGWFNEWWKRFASDRDKNGYMIKLVKF
jgi:hypothetical protein